MVNNANFPFIPGQGGRLALDRYDAQAHFNGTNFRHTADQIDILHPSLVYGDPSTVEQALENLAGIPASITALGVAYISIPDGYNCWASANGTDNLNPNTPFLDAFLNPLFAAITATQSGTYTALPAQYARLQYGGVVYIPAGTYMVQNTINVPPSITLLGEVYGTKLVNVSSIALPASIGSPAPVITSLTITAATNTNPIEITASTNTLKTGQTVIIDDVGGNTNANNAAANPYWVITVIDSTHFTLNGSMGNASYTSGGNVYLTRSILNILPDTNRTSATGIYPDDGAVSGGTNPFMFARSTNIFNMVLADNFVEPTILGDTDYKEPQNFTNANDSGFPAAPALISQQQGSNLVIKNVVGMGRVQFSSGTVVSNATSSFVNTSSSAGLPSGAILGTYLTIDGCLIDGFSLPFYFAGLGGSFDFVSLTNSKVRAYGYYTGDASNSYNNTFIQTSDANVIVANNSLYGNAHNVTSVVMIDQVAGSVPAAGAKSKLVGKANVLLTKNSTLANNAMSLFYPNPSVSNILSYISIEGYPIYVGVAASPYPVDVSATEVLLLADTSTGAITITLSNALSVGQTITIKDIGGMASTNNITITPITGQAIEGGSASANYIYSTNYGSITLKPYNSGWWVT